MSRYYVLRALLGTRDILVNKQARSPEPMKPPLQRGGKVIHIVNNHNIYYVRWWQMIWRKINVMGGK